MNDADINTDWEHTCSVHGIFWPDELRSQPEPHLPACPYCHIELVERAEAAEAERDALKESNHGRLVAAWDDLASLRDQLQGRFEQIAELEAERDAIQAKFDHLHSEYSYDRPRGDHVVYRDEWEAFDEWQRSGDRMEEESYAWQHRAEAAEARVQQLKAALAQIVAYDCPDGHGGAGFAHVRSIARAALADPEETP